MGGAAYWQSDRLQAGIEGADSVARMFLGRARAAQPVFIDGEPGAVWMHDGKVRVAFRFRIRNDRIAAIDLVADPDAIARSVIER
jgi:RNA polymerase sigma-70 factor (ECF subfamily)